MAWILDEYSKFHGHSPTVVIGKPLVSFFCCYGFFDSALCLKFLFLSTCSFQSNRLILVCCFPFLALDTIIIESFPQLTVSRKCSCLFYLSGTTTDLNQGEWVEIRRLSRVEGSSDWKAHKRRRLLRVKGSLDSNGPQSRRLVNNMKSFWQDDMVTCFRQNSRSFVSQAQISKPKSDVILVSKFVKNAQIRIYKNKGIYSN